MIAQTGRCVGSISTLAGLSSGLLFRTVEGGNHSFKCDHPIALVEKVLDQAPTKVRLPARKFGWPMNSPRYFPAAKGIACEPAGVLGLTFSFLFEGIDCRQNPLPHTNMPS
jgi:hypothetical protein